MATERGKYLQSQIVSVFNWSETITCTINLKRLLIFLRTKKKIHEYLILRIQTKSTHRYIKISKVEYSTIKPV